MKRFLCMVFALAFILPFSVQCFADGGTELTAAQEEILAAEGDAVTTALPFELDAESVILMEVSSGRVLLESNADKRLYPASITKVMTMLLIAEAIDSGKITLEDKVAASANACSKGGSQIWLEEGEVMSVHELLKATAVGSANDAATALGEYISGSESGFVDLMNKRAAELGMTNTHFDNPTGLDDTSETHLSTARDIAIMSCELLKHKFIEEYTTIWMDSLRNGATELVNTNKLVRFYNGTTGLKTGTTSKAGFCVSASARRNGLHLVAVILNSKDSTKRFEAAKTLLSYGFSNYTLLEPKINTEEIKGVPIWYGEKNFVVPTLPDIIPILIEKGKEGSVTSEITITENVEAPVEEGQVLGKIKFISEGNVIAEYSLTSPCKVPRLSFLGSVERILRFLATGSVYEA